MAGKAAREAVERCGSSRDTKPDRPLHRRKWKRPLPGYGVSRSRGLYWNKPIEVDGIICPIASRSTNCYTCRVKFRVTIESDEDGVFVAECPALPGCISQGKTRDEAMANIRDAIQSYVESWKKHGEPIPAPITEAVVEVSM